MKKTLLSLFVLILLFQGVCISQTLTATDCNPAVGDRFKIYIPSGTYSYVPGASGKDQTWNFIDMPCSGSTPAWDTIIGPGSPSYTFPPGANMVYNGYQIRNYIKASSATLEKVGEFYPNQIVYTDPETLLAYPLSYGNTMSDNYAYTRVSGTTTANISGAKTYTVDGTGWIVTPGGNFNALRVFSRTILSFTANPGNVTGTSIEEQYDWYTAGIHVPILTIHYGNVGSPTESKNAFFYAPKCTNYVGIDEKSISSHIIVFPNPVSDKLTFRSESEGFNKIIIVNGIGDQVLEYINEQNNEAVIDLSVLPEGFYVIKAYEGNGLIAQKKFLVSR